MAEEEIRESAERTFQAYGIPLDMVTPFKYMVQVLMVADDAWLAVVGNLWNEWKSWEQMVRNMVWEGASPMVSGIFFKADILT